MAQVVEKNQVAQKTANEDEANLQVFLSRSQAAFEGGECREANYYLESRHVRHKEASRFGVGAFNRGQAIQASSGYPELNKFVTRVWGSGTRLVFPLRNVVGNLRSIETRDIDQKSFRDFQIPAAKFEGVFFGFHECVETVYNLSRIYIVESIIDVLALMEVASAWPLVAIGTNGMSAPQEATVRRFVKAIGVCFDRDGPGIEGWKRLVHKKSDLPCRIATLQWDGVDGVDMQGIKDFGDMIERYGKYSALRLLESSFGRP